jgi:hypothetical protein
MKLIYITLQLLLQEISEPGHTVGHAVEYRNIYMVHKYCKSVGTSTVGTREVDPSGGTPFRL